MNMILLILMVLVLPLLLLLPWLLSKLTVTIDWRIKIERRFPSPISLPWLIQKVIRLHPVHVHGPIVSEKTPRNRLVIRLTLLRIVQGESMRLDYFNLNISIHSVVVASPSRSLALALEIPRLLVMGCSLEGLRHRWQSPGQRSGVNNVEVMLETSSSSPNWSIVGQEVELGILLPRRNCERA